MKISVLMPVYATPVEWLKESVDSIICQDHPDFNFIIVDDNNPKGPITEYLYNLVERDCCINIVRKDSNEGIAAALNFGLQYCTGDLVVRMDGDDIAHPLLLKSHNKYFETNLNHSICGVQIHLFNNEREWWSCHPSMVNRKLASQMPGHWFVNHPGIAYTKKAIDEVGRYDATPSTLAEDYALWVKFLLAGYTIYNSDLCLIHYRVHPKSFSFAPDRKSAEWHQFLKQQKNLLYEQ